MFVVPFYPCLDENLSPNITTRFERTFTLAVKVKLDYYSNLTISFSLANTTLST